jgi:hypothetical protein
VAGITPEGRKKLAEGSMLSAGVVLAALLLALVNYFGWKYHRRLDWTKASLYSLSEKTKNVLAGLDRDVEVVVFTSPGAQLASEVEEILSRYDALSPHLSVRVVDPAKNLAEAERLLQQYGTRYVVDTVKVVFEAADERRIFEGDQLAEMDFSSMQFGGAAEIASFNGEEVFNGALIELASGRQAKVLFSTGHGERKPSDFSGRGLRAAEELLRRNNLTTEEWRSLGQTEVPAGTDLVVVAGPTTSFIRPELELFDAYLARGGRMLWLLDPTLAPGGGLVDLGISDWLARYGVRLGADAVQEPAKSVPSYSPETFFADAWSDHPTTRALRENELPVILALARSVGKAEETPGYTVTKLLETGGEGWGEIDFDGAAAPERGAGDLAGPVSLAVAVEKAPDGAQGAAPQASGAAGSGAATSAVPALRMVVIGDSDFASDSLVVQVQSNAILLDNALNWLLARESLLGIPPKKPEQVRLTLTGDEMLTILALVALLPLATVVGGIAVYLKRRR